MPEIFAYVISNFYNKPPRWALLSVLHSCGKIGSERWSASQCLITGTAGISVLNSLFSLPHGTGICDIAIPTWFFFFFLFCIALFQLITITLLTSMH